MTKILSELVAYRNRLRSAEFDPHTSQITEFAQRVTHSIVTHSVQFPACTADIRSRCKQVLESVSNFRKELDFLQSEIETEILRLDRVYYQRSSRWFTQESIWDKADYVLSRRLEMLDEGKEMLRARLRANTDWRFPGMIIHPGLEDFIDIMVGYDPLYIVDRSAELMIPAVRKFAEQYQHRVRRYVIDDHGKTDVPILGALPDGQFGMIFVYNYFNFVPLEVMTRYLQELTAKLRDGGTMLFTFNDCDREEAVGSTEKNFMCYTPGHKVREVLRTLNLEILLDQHCDKNVSWMEVRRSGKLRSYRGSQPVAKILRKP